MPPAPRIVPVTPEDGFNELATCRDGPMLYLRHDNVVGRSLQLYGEFSRGEAELFAAVLRPGDVVVEVGANIGAHTVALSQLVAPSGFVVAFEPQRLVFQLLCANLALNSRMNVFATQEAVGATEAVVSVPFLNPHAPENAGSVSLAGAGAAPPGEMVRQRTLDTLGLPACRLLKVDVEGMEGAVLAGASQTIAHYRPLLYVENDRAEHSASLIAQILGLGYRLYWHVTPLFARENFAGETENVFPGIVSINMFGVPAEADATIAGLRPVTGPDDRWDQKR